MCFDSLAGKRTCIWSFHCWFPVHLFGCCCCCCCCCRIVFDLATCALRYRAGRRSLCSDLRVWDDASVPPWADRDGAARHPRVVRPCPGPPARLQQVARGVPRTCQEGRRPPRHPVSGTHVHLGRLMSGSKDIVGSLLPSRLTRCPFLFCGKNRTRWLVGRSIAISLRSTWSRLDARWSPSFCSKRWRSRGRCQPRSSRPPRPATITRLRLVDTGACCCWFYLHGGEGVCRWVVFDNAFGAH